MHLFIYLSNMADYICIHSTYIHFIKKKTLVATFYEPVIARLHSPTINSNPDDKVDSIKQNSLKIQIVRLKNTQSLQMQFERLIKALSFHIGSFQYEVPYIKIKQHIVEHKQSLGLLYEKKNG